MNGTNEYREAWERERAYAAQNADAIRQQYGTDFIAIKDGKVIDSDKDELNLLERVDEQLIDMSVLVSTLDDILNPKVAHLPSPEC